MDQVIEEKKQQQQQQQQQRAEEKRLREDQLKEQFGSRYRSPTTRARLRDAARRAARQAPKQIKSEINNLKAKMHELDATHKMELQKI